MHYVAMQSFLGDNRTHTEKVLTSIRTYADVHIKQGTVISNVVQWFYHRCLGEGSPQN